jgi:DNA-directed RNA polymerase subunit K/omega
MEIDARSLLEGRRGKYLLVNALSRRIRGLHSGNKPLVARPMNDLTAVAMEEFRQQKVRIELTQDTKGSEIPEETPAEK